MPRAPAVAGPSVDVFNSFHTTATTTATAAATTTITIIIIMQK